MYDVAYLILILILSFLLGLFPLLIIFNRRSGTWVEPNINDLQQRRVLGPVLPPVVESKDTVLFDLGHTPCREGNDDQLRP